MNRAVPLTLHNELIRYKTIALLYRLMATAEELELPKPSIILPRVRHQLEENRYNVLVVGATKRGKTTLINALIGQAILPVETGAAMGQVFRVCQAEQEAYRLRFEDGSQQEITAADLLRFGSQGVEPAPEGQSLDHILRWIEVEVPVRFLPEGVSLWDIPSSGSLSTTPTQMTQRFVPHTDAVIYLLDSRQPIGQSDLDFIETILEATPHLFFIQTKIDQYDRAHWETVQQRNQDILSECLEHRLSEARIWPVSSLALLQAAAAGHDDNGTRSRHQDLLAALQAFLFRVAGWNRSAEAVTVAKHYHALSRQTLVGRLSALTETSEEKRAALQHTAEDRQQEFEAEWGQTGTKRHALMTSIEKAITIGRQNFEAALQPGGEIERAGQRQIEALTSMDAAKKLSPRLKEEVLNTVINKWLQVCEFSQKECVTLMTPFFTEAVTLPQETSQPHIEFNDEFNIEEEWLRNLQAGGKEMMDLSKLAGLPLAVLIGTSVVTGPVGALALAATGLWGFVHGWSTSEQAQLNEARNRLTKHVSSLLQDVRHYFFGIELTTERLSVVDQYFEGLRRFITERIETISSQKSSEARAEMARLVENAPLDDEQRQAKAQQLQQQLAAWDTIGATIQHIMADLEVA